MLTLDGRIPIAELSDGSAKKRIAAWMQEAVLQVGVAPVVAASLQGPVFEIRQGYKSKDAKRSNADIGNAGAAYAQAWFPVAMILSNQIDGDVADAYQRARWLLLRGVEDNSPSVSTYAFFRDVLRYDLAGFFKRNSGRLTRKVEEVLETLLAPETPKAPPTTELADLEENGREEVEP